MEFNVKLQELRKAKGLTQEELAAALFVSRTAVSKWESGKGYPSIDSLKAIAVFFEVTVDGLLSGEELLTVAQEDSRQSRAHLRDLVCGLLDVCVLMLWMLPFFGQERNGLVEGASLLFLTALSPWLIGLYHAAVIGIAVIGIATLALQNCQHARWLRLKGGLSLAVGLAAVVLFIVSRQPYAATFLLILTAIKAFLLLRRP